MHEDPLYKRNEKNKSLYYNSKKRTKKNVKKKERKVEREEKN